MNPSTTIAAVSTCMSISVPTAAASPSSLTESGAASETTSAMAATMTKVRSFRIRA